MRNISKRDVKVFLLGMLTMFLIEVALDWRGSVEDFKRGFRDGYEVK